MEIDDVYDAFEWPERLKKVEGPRHDKHVGFKTVRAILVTLSLCSALLIIVTMLNRIMDSLSVTRYPLSYEIFFIVISCTLIGVASMMFTVKGE